jgi:hypothetical protein
MQAIRTFKDCVVGAAIVTLLVQRLERSEERLCRSWGEGSDEGSVRRRIRGDECSRQTKSCASAK